MVKSWEISDETKSTESADIANEWFTAKFNEVLAEINDGYDKFRISDVLMTTYKLVWDEFCSWYLEWMKPTYGKPIPAADLTIVKENFEN